MKKLNYQVLEEQGYDGFLLKDAPERVLQFGGDVGEPAVEPGAVAGRRCIGVAGGTRCVRASGLNRFDLGVLC